MVRDVRLGHTLVLFALLGCPAPKPVPIQVTPRPPSPLATHPPSASPLPTLRLPRQFTPTGYAATLSIDPAKTTFDGVIAITGDVTQATPTIWLHGRELQIRRATATKATASVAISVTPRGEDLLELHAEPALEPGTWVLTFEYSGKYDLLNTAGAFKQTVAGSQYIYSQLEALYARRVFPCLDEPDSKVPWQLTLDVPKTSIAVSNTPIARETPLDGGRHRYEFAKTKPLPSYLVAFGVGPFDVVDGGKTKSGVPVRVLAMKGRAADATYAAKTTARILDLLEEWFAIRYPYEKMDILTIPLTVGFGAMENAGLITANEHITLFDPKKPSWDDRLRYVRVMAHELAHQWFGDYVTMAWWDDIWLNEGFATWLDEKITTRFDPTWHGERGALDLVTDALELDSLVSARRVRQPIEKVDDIYNAFDHLTYVKGAAVLNTFEAFVGPDKFQLGVREYLKARAFGNATSADFVAAISAAAGRDVAPAFSTLLDRPGAPEIEARLVCDKASPPRIELAQQRYVPAGSPDPAPQPPWIVPVCVAFERDGKRAQTCTLLDKETDTLALDAKSCPRWLMPNANGGSYYRARYTPAQATSLRDEAWAQLSWSERRSAFFDIASAARQRARAMRKTPGQKVPLALALSFVPKLLAGGDRFTLADALDLPLRFDRLVTDDQRPKYEAWLRATFGPAAAKLGLVPKDSDDLDTETVRSDVIHAVAWTGRDPDLVKQSVELAQSWRDVPGAIRELVLTIAADASPELFAKLLHDLRTEVDRERRRQVFAALAATRDPKRVEAALALILDPQIDIRESLGMLGGTSTETTRKVAERFVRANVAALLARMPKETVTGGIGELAKVFTDSCDPAARDEAYTYVTTSFGKLPGGERVIRQSFETMDQCIAMRKQLEPELRAFLAGVKLAKPKAKPSL